MLKLKKVVMPLAIAGLLAGCSTTYQPNPPVAYSAGTYSYYPHATGYNGYNHAGYPGAVGYSTAAYPADTYGYYYGNVFIPAVYTPVESQSGVVPH